MPRDHRICRYRGKFAVSYIDDNGQRQRRSTGATDRRQAEAFLSELLKHERSTRPAPTTTIGEIWEGYRLTLGSRPAATTMIHEWKALKGRFGSVRASDLLAVDRETNRTTAETLSAEHTAARREQGRKDGAILTELSRLRTACNWAVERGKLEKAPVWIMPPKPRARARHLSRAQFATFLDACHMPHLRLFAVLAIGTGGRMGAILDLTWDRIDFEAGPCPPGRSRARQDSEGPRRGPDDRLGPRCAPGRTPGGSNTLCDRMGRGAGQVGQERGSGHWRPSGARPRQPARLPTLALPSGWPRTA